MASIEDRVGPVFSREQVTEAGLDPEALISLRLDRFRDVFPTSQFDVAAGRLVPRRDLVDVWADLRAAGVGQVKAWLWLSGRREEFDRLSPVQWLTRRGRDVHFEAALATVLPPASAVA